MRLAKINNQIRLKLCGLLFDKNSIIAVADIKNYNILNISRNEKYCVKIIHDL